MGQLPTPEKFNKICRIEIDCDPRLLLTKSSRTYNSTMPKFQAKFLLRKCFIHNSEHIDTRNYSLFEALSTFFRFYP